jgi:hypothetical protein
VNIRARGGKSSLIRILHLTGVSYRKAERGVNAVFELIAAALGGGEIVDIPGGALMCQQVSRKPSLRFTRLRNVNTGMDFYRFVRFPGRQFRIHFRADRTLIFDPLAVTRNAQRPVEPVRDHDAVQPPMTFGPHWWSWGGRRVLIANLAAQ